MRQKLYTLLIALAALAVSASATAQITKYGLYVAGTQVTSANASDITAAIGDPAKATGTITYNAATKTLTLNNAKITSDGDGIQCYIRTTIRLEGASAVTVTGSNGILFYMAPGTITGSGSLEVTAADVAVFHLSTSLIIRDCTLKASGKWGICGNNGSASETLVVENASVKAKGESGSIADISSLTLTGCAITSPTGAAFDPSKKGVAAGGELVKNEWVEIKPVIMEYPLKVAGTQVTSANAKDITASGISGTVSYIHSTKTLTLNNATIRIASGVDESAIAANQTLNIHMIGNNEIVHAGSRYGIENTQYDLIFKGAKNSKLLIMNNYDPITYSGIFSDSGGVSFLDDCNVQIISADNGILANSIDINQNSKVMVKSTNAGFSTPRYALNTQESIKVNGASTLEAIGKSYAIWVSGYGLTAYPGAELREGTSVTSYEIVDRLTFTDAKSKPYVLIHPSGTGLESLTSQGIRVWGGKGVIKIVPPAELVETNTAYIYGVSGTLVRALPLGSGDMFVSNIPAGIYMVKIGDAAEKVIVR